jgi:hypothetical protein
MSGFDFDPNESFEQALSEPPRRRTTQGITSWQL